MPDLLRIHIGPVQDFIVSARRSRDLWYGSWMLSELSKAAARSIAQTDIAGLDALVFPNPPDMEALRPGSDFAVINEIVAIVSDNPINAAERSRDAVRTQLGLFKNDAFNQTQRSGLRTWDVAEKQIDDLVEFYWVSVPLVDYAESRALADRLLAARKNTRSFSAVPWHSVPPPTSAPPKSSLDGARESVVDQDVVRNRQEMYRRYKARRGEQLSGVDLLKRLGNSGQADRFPSTSHMATIPLGAQLQDNDQAIEAWASYLEKLDGLAQDLTAQERIYHQLQLPVLGDHDGSLLFASRLSDYLEGDALRHAEKSLDEFFKTAEVDRPLPYYALLVGDGDFMGRTISHLVTVDENRQFSSELAGFADQAKVVVSNHGGAVIFAGGDDVLALLPLHTAIQCAAELASSFRAALQAYDQSGSPPTFSAGIAIVHHLEPLEDALVLARKAEASAKAFPDGTKNALAVALDKRSGVMRTVRGHWDELDRRLLNLAALHQDGLISSRLAYQLQDTYKSLGSADETPSGDDLHPLLSSEAERLIERKRISGGDQVVAPAHADYLATAVSTPGVGIASLSDELIIASHIAIAATMAKVELEFTDEEEQTV